VDGVSDESTIHESPLLDGRYRLDGLVGAGGMGQVHRAWDTRLGRRVAIKMLGPEPVADPAVAARLRAEGRHLASIAHPNLVTLYDVSADGAIAYLVMELIDGESLAERLRREGPLPAREVAAIVTGIAAGLSALHGAGIVHRDVSPANILLGRDGRPRLADLGLAHELDRPDAQASDGMIHGTLRYLAPELLDGGSATPASDVFALAAVTYAALLGRPPAVATDVVKLRAAHREPPIRPSLLRPGLDPALDEVLLRALGPVAGRPTAYAFAVAIANALRACDDPAPRPTDAGRPVAGPVGVAYHSPRSRTAGRSTRRLVAAVGAGALVLALAGGALAALDGVLERPVNPELVAGLTGPAGTPPVAVTIEAEEAAAGRAIEPARRLETRGVEAGRDASVGPGAVERLTPGPSAQGAVPPAGLAADADPRFTSRGWTDQVTGSIAAALTRLAGAALAVDPDTGSDDVIPTIAPEQLPAGGDVQLAVVGSADRRTAAAAAERAAQAGRAGSTLATAPRDPGARVATGTRATTGDRAARAGSEGGRSGRDDRDDRASTALREDRSGRDDDRKDREDREDREDDREDRAEDRKDDREDREDREDDREDRSGKG
jgi:serine/threonine-protein kinase